MTTPQKFELLGAATLGAVSPVGAFPANESSFPIAVSQITQGSSVGARRINTPSPGFLDLLAGTGITSLRYLVLIVRNGVFVVRMSSSAGADQLLTVSEFIAFSNPQSGSQITALAIQGVGDIDLVMAGD